MSNLVIEVSVLGGADLLRTVKEAIVLATQLNSGVSFNFNGVSLIVFGHSNPDEKVKEYDQEISKPKEG